MTCIDIKLFTRALKIVEVIEENYSDIGLVFSGRRGFHIHVFDFEIADWTHIDEHNQLKSHEVVRFLYTYLFAEKVPEAFDKSHFNLSAGTLRFISMPESLYAVTGVSCSYLGDSNQFRRLSFREVLRKSKGAKATITGLNWSSASNMEFRPISSQFDSNDVGE